MFYVNHNATFALAIGPLRSGALGLSMFSLYLDTFWL